MDSHIQPGAQHHSLEGVVAYLPSVYDEVTVMLFPSLGCKTCPLG